MKVAEKIRSKPTTHFTNIEVAYAYPDGLIMPLVYGLKALMAIDTNGCVKWNEDPGDFLDRYLKAIVKKYKVILEAFRYDAQKIAKNEGSYSLVLDAFETEVIRPLSRCFEGGSTCSLDRCDQNGSAMGVPGSVASLFKMVAMGRKCRCGASVNEVPDVSQKPLRRTASAGKRLWP
ncbi:MAG TPA: hypothetical protein VNZ53_34875 [Steroidobacteraceae bacterium]|nr:hypothetical protein [Steroidobacteraceae bacterium]